MRPCTAHFQILRIPESSERSRDETCFFIFSLATVGMKNRCRASMQILGILPANSGLLRALS